MKNGGMLTRERPKWRRDVAGDRLFLSLLRVIKSACACQYLEGNTAKLRP